MRVGVCRPDPALPQGHGAVPPPIEVDRGGPGRPAARSLEVVQEVGGTPIAFIRCRRNAVWHGLGSRVAGQLKRGHPGEWVDEVPEMPDG